MAPKKMNLGAGGSAAEAREIVKACGSDGPKNSETAKEIKRTYAAQKRWHAAHPWAGWAHAAVRSAVRRGLIERQPCEICGADPADAHHEGGEYDRPLTTVRFLCRRHHRQAHIVERRGAK